MFLAQNGSFSKFLEKVDRGQHGHGRVYEHGRVHEHALDTWACSEQPQELLYTRPGHMAVSRAVYSLQNAKNMHFSSATLALSVHNHYNQSKTQLQHL